MKKIRVAGYCRVSTEKDDQINSLESQIRYFSEYINNQTDWQLYKIYYDEGISGTSTKKREQFNQMIADAECGRFELIITKEVSRFARNTVDTLTYVRKLKERGIGVRFMNDNIDTLDNDGELRLTIMSSIAQEESRKTSERVKWGQKRRMEQGVVFGRDMLGYKVQNGKMYIIPEEAETVRLIFHKFLNEEKGTHIIARELRECGIKPKIVKEWANTVILRVLKNEKYVGDLCQKKTYTPNFLDHKKKYNRGAEDMVYIKNHHEPIIDRDTWDRTQKELARRSPSAEQKSKHSNRYWCSGKIKCGECGQSFVSRTKKLKDGSIYKAWRCYAAAHNGSKKLDCFGNEIGCDNTAVNDRVLIASVGYVLNLIQINKDKLIAEMCGEIKSLRNFDTKINVEDMYTAIEKTERKKAALIDSMLEGIITKDEMIKQKAYYDEEISLLSEKISEAQRHNEIIESQVSKIEGYIGGIRKILDFTDPNEEICHEVLDRIVVYQNKELEVFLKCMPNGVRVRFETEGKKEGYKVLFDVVKD